MSKRIDGIEAEVARLRAESEGRRKALFEIGEGRRQAQLACMREAARADAAEARSAWLEVALCDATGQPAEHFDECMKAPIYVPPVNRIAGNLIKVKMAAEAVASTVPSLKARIAELEGMVAALREALERPDDRYRCSGCEQVSETEYDCQGHYYADDVLAETEAAAKAHDDRVRAEALREMADRIREVTDTFRDLPRYRAVAESRDGVVGSMLALADDLDPRHGK